MGMAEMGRLTSVFKIGWSYWNRAATVPRAGSAGGFRVTKTGPYVLSGRCCKRFMLSAGRE